MTNTLPVKPLTAKIAAAPAAGHATHASR